MQLGRLMEGGLGARTVQWGGLSPLRISAGADTEVHAGNGSPQDALRVEVTYGHLSS